MALQKIVIMAVGLNQFMITNGRPFIRSINKIQKQYTCRLKDIFCIGTEFQKELPVSMFRHYYYQIENPNTK